MSIQPRYEPAAAETFESGLHVVPAGSGGEGLAPALERERAQEQVGGLDDREQDILALVTMGLSLEEVEAKIYFSKTTIRRYMLPALYKKLDIESSAPSANKGPRAVRTAWDSGLLQDAWQAKLAGSDKFPGTKKAMAEHKLAGNDIANMSQYRLTVQQLRLAKRLAGGMNYSQIAREWSMPVATVTHRARRVKQQLGSEAALGDFKNMFANNTKGIANNREGLDRLSTRQKDILALAALGLSSEEIGTRFKLANETISCYLTQIYSAMAVPKIPGITRQAGAREIAWAGGLLEAALDEAASLTKTKQEIETNGLNGYDIAIMSEHGLTIPQLRLLKQKAQRLTYAQICKQEGLNEHTLSSRFREIRKRLGSKEAVDKLAGTIAGGIGSMALSSELARH